MALCDPLLSVLGWDVADPGLVMPEYNVSGRRADYALLGPDGQPVATIEAKKLGASLEAHRMQMLNYSNASDVEYAGLTDGDRWELYEVFKRGQLEDRRILDVSISGMAAHECALRLLLLWRPNLESGKPVAANEPVFGGGVSAEGEANFDEPPASGTWVSLAEYDPRMRQRLPPSLIRFPDGERDDLRRWSDLLVSVAEWLVATGRLTAANVPVASSGRGYMVNHQPVHPTGKAFIRYKTLSNGLVVFTNYTGADLRKCARKLLDHCGVRADAVWLQSSPAAGG